jgi:CheY-like chemotaxis protein
MPNLISHVLAVEDDPDIQVILKMVLTRLGKAEVALTSQGCDVLSLARTHHPGVILLDVMLPDMSGFDIIKMLKADDACRDIPVIFLTARSMPEELQEMKKLGALGYVAKPFDPMTLVGQINELLAPFDRRLGGC